MFLGDYLYKLTRDSSVEFTCVPRLVHVWWLLVGFSYQSRELLSAVFPTFHLPAEHLLSGSLSPLRSLVNKASILFVEGCRRRTIYKAFEH